MARNNIVQDRDMSLNVALPPLPPIEQPAGNETGMPVLNADGLVMPELPPPIVPPTNGAVQNPVRVPNEEDDDSSSLATSDASNYACGAPEGALLSPESTSFGLLESPFKRPLLSESSKENSPDSVKETSVLMPSSLLGAKSLLTISSKTKTTVATTAAMSPMEESSKPDMSTAAHARSNKKPRGPHVATMNEVSCTETFHEQGSSYKEEINSGYLKAGFFFHARSCHVCNTAITKVGVRQPAFYCMHCRNHFLCNTCFRNNLMTSRTQV